MFEGKHIHFSPLDNKPLCSYSSKLCRQRRLNGYAFCIRHILEDKSAPFKQCGFVTRNNYQKCLNAIPANQERGYCHSHMQVAGFIPKTERKNKTGNPTAVVGSSMNNESSSERSSFAVTSNCSSSISHNEKPGKFLPSQDSRSYCLKERKGVVSMNTRSPQGNANIPQMKMVSANEKSSATIPSLLNINKGNSPVDLQIDETHSQNKVLHYSLSDCLDASTNIQPNADAETHLTMKNQIWKLGKETICEKTGNKNLLSKQKLTNSVVEKSFLSNIVDPVNSCCNPVYTLCVRDRWKQFQFDSNDDGISTKTGLKLKHLKAVQVLEKLPLFMEIPAENATTIHHLVEEERKNDFVNSFVSSGVDVVLLPPFISKKKLGNNVFTYSMTSGGENRKRCCYNKVDGRSSSEITSRLKAENVEETDKLWEWESRKDFLSRVRRAFKRQYKTMMKVCKFREKMQKSDRAFRSALLSCAVRNTSLCAQILSKNDPKFQSGPSNALREWKFDFGEQSSEKLENDKSIMGELKSKIPFSMCFQNSYSSGYLNCTASKTEKDPQSVLRKGRIGSIDHRKCKASKSDGSVWQHQPAIEQNLLKCTKNVHIHKMAEEITPCGSPRLQILTTVKGKEKNTTAENDNSLKLKHKKLGCQASAKKRKFATENDLPAPNVELLVENSHCYKNLATVGSNYLSKDLVIPEDRLLGTTNIQSNLENILHSVNSSEAATIPDGVATETSFDSPFNHSNSSHRDCEFSDDDLEKSFELQIDPEIAHQASRLLEDNGLTEDDFNELFPEARVGDQKQPGRSDLGDLGIDFTSNFDASDIDYSLFANIFPNFRSNQHESISVHQQF